MHGSSGKAPFRLVAGVALFLFGLPASPALADTAPPVSKGAPAHPAASAPASGSQGAKRPAPAPDPLAVTEDALRHAPGAAEARSLEAKADALRGRHLQAVVRLLVQHADKSLASHDFRAAETAASDAIVLQPDQAILRRARAQIRFAAGDFDGAIADLGVALQRDAGDVPAWEMLSDVEAGRHDYKAAVEALDRVAVLDPYRPGLAARRRKLVLLRDGQPA